MSQGRIQLFKPIYRVDEVLSEIKECLLNGWTGAGFKTLEFEDEFKKYTGLQHAHFLNSATSGLHLALEIIKRKHKFNNYRVATTPLTFISTNHAILNSGMDPRFVDIDLSLCMDAEKLEYILKYNTFAAVIFVGIGGNPGSLTEVSRICDYYKVPLILDASHMVGTFIDGKHVGNQADFTIFSFQAVKNLSTGDGGMICCKEKRDDTLARKLSWLGINKDTWNRIKEDENWDYDVEDVGYKYHGNSIAASMGIVGLKYLEDDNSVRRSQRFLYYQHLNTEAYRIVFHPTDYKNRTSSHLFQVRVLERLRDKIIGYARTHAVELGVHYKVNTAYNMYIRWLGKLPNAEAASRELISLPIGVHLHSDDIFKVIEVMNDAWNHLA